MSSTFPLASLVATPRSRRIESSPLTAYAGLWKGAFSPDGGHGTVPFAIRHDGMLAGEHPELVFPTRSVPPIAVRLVEASATAYIAVTAPFTDPTSGEVVMLHMTGARHGNRLTGRYALRREDGSAVREGRWLATRYGSAELVNYRW